MISTPRYVGDRRTISIKIRSRRLRTPRRGPGHLPNKVHHGIAKRILREVEDAICRRTKRPEAETLKAELLDRLDSPDLDEDLAA